MKKYSLYFVCLLAFAMSFCSKKNDVKPKSIIGKWTLSQLCANDHWGGKLYWQPAKTDAKAEFTNNHQYLRKDARKNSYTLVGTYQILSDSTMKITYLDPTNNSYYTRADVLNYSFETADL